jgi:hypothetical protein
LSVRNVVRPALLHGADWSPRDDHKLAARSFLIHAEPNYALAQAAYQARAHAALRR